MGPQIIQKAHRQFGESRNTDSPCIMGSVNLSFPPDEGNATVILSTVDYTQKNVTFPEDSLQQKLVKEPIQLMEW
jgi:hypothetical protein